MKKCKIDGCENKHCAKGYCGKHYSKFNKYGDAEAGKEIEQHGMFDSAEYASWQAMKERCYRPKHISFKNYGGKGIKVCDRWLNSFKAFFNDMGLKPSKNHSLERIDSKKDYEPNNCRWATSQEQNQNQKTTKLNPHSVLEIRSSNKSCEELSKKYGVSPSTIYWVITRRSWKNI